VHDLRCGERAVADEAVDGAYTDAESASSLVNGDGLRGVCVGVEGGETKPLPQLAHANGRPGCAIRRLTTHPVHCDGQFAVGPLPAHLPNYLDRARVPIGWVAAGSYSRDADLRVASSRPVNRYDSFVGSVVEIDDDFLDENANDALLGPHVGARRVPRGGQVVREREQGCAVYPRPCGALTVQVPDAILEPGDASQGSIPPGLQLTCDKPLRRVHCRMSARREIGLVLGLFEFTGECVADIVILLRGAILRCDRRVHTVS